MIVSSHASGKILDRQIVNTMHKLRMRFVDELEKGEHLLHLVFYRRSEERRIGSAARRSRSHFHLYGNPRRNVDRKTSGAEVLSGICQSNCRKNYRSHCLLQSHYSRSAASDGGGRDMHIPTVDRNRSGRCPDRRLGSAIKLRTAVVGWCPGHYRSISECCRTRTGCLCHRPCIGRRGGTRQCRGIG